ncbi:MAG: radical SAM protein [Candidatus Buchananbacteria bacterium]|nr:radical SAM protein [Candidatus Buchananbacteria bacterium]
MKIFILNPCLFTGKLNRLARKRQPLSLAYIASLLRTEHEIKLVDANAINLTLEETIKEIKDFNPDIFILTSTPIDRWEVPSHSHIKLLISNLVEIINNINIPQTIITGSHGTVMPDWILQNSQINFVVRGEPELIVVELVQALVSGSDISKIAGISYWQGNKVISNPDAPRNANLDDLPYPAYDLLPMDKYRYTFTDIPQPFALMMSSRGCPFNCIYCLKEMMKGRYITRTPQNVVAEMKYLAEKFKIKGIYFQDWEFLIVKQRVIEICDLIKENNLDIKWGGNARASDVTEDVALKMKEAGCVRINIGFETGSQKVLDIAKKQIKLSEVKHAISVCKKLGINMGLYSILNLPGETRETIKETEKFLADNNLKVMCAASLPVPYFKTKLYEMLKDQEGKDFDWDNLEKFAGRVGVAQPPWLAKIYRFHYKYKYVMGTYYFLMPKFYLQFLKLIKAKVS